MAAPRREAGGKRCQTQQGEQGAGRQRLRGWGGRVLYQQPKRLPAGVDARGERGGAGGAALLGRLTFLSRNDAIRPKFLGCCMNLRGEKGGPETRPRGAARLACGIQFPDQGSNPGPLHWEHGLSH